MVNWRTTLSGILGGLIIAFGPSVGGRLSGDPSALPITAQNYLPAIGLAVLGILAKDKNVTGGSVMQPTPPEVIQAKAVEAQNAVGGTATVSNFPATH